MKLFLCIASVMCIALNMDAAKRKLRDQLGSAIESTAHVRYCKDVVLTEEQKRVLVACVASRARYWFKSPQRFTQGSIRCNEIVVSNAQKNMTGWVVDWRFQFIKKRQATIWISQKDFDFVMKNQDK